MSNDYEALRVAQREALERRERENREQEAARQAQANETAHELEPDGGAARRRAQERAEAVYLHVDSGDMVSQEAAALAYNKVVQNRQAELHARERDNSAAAFVAAIAATRNDGQQHDPTHGPPDGRANEVEQPNRDPSGPDARSSMKLEQANATPGDRAQDSGLMRDFVTPETKAKAEAEAAQELTQEREKTGRQM